jgi:hypothetical protein
MISRIALELLSGMILTAQPRPVPVIPDSLAADSYAVYSVLLNHPKFSHGNGGNEKLLIKDTTGFKTDKPEGCLHPPELYKSAIAEINRDAERHLGEAYRLERNFALSTPYELLNDADAKLFEKERVLGIQSGTVPLERFRGAIDLIEIGAVHFNRGRTVAAVRVGSWCGGLFGSWIWRVVEKKDGHWQELELDG